MLEDNVCTVDGCENPVPMPDWSCVPHNMVAMRRKHGHEWKWLNA
jgi:hypothetical protein